MVLPRSADLVTKSLVALGVTIVTVAISAHVLGNTDKVHEGFGAVVDFLQQGNRGLCSYLVSTVVGAVFLLPTEPIEFVGGLLLSPAYGMWETLLYTVLAKLAANLIGMLLARYVFGDWLLDNVVNKFDFRGKISFAVGKWKTAFLGAGSMLPLSLKDYGPVFSLILTTFYAFQNIYLGSVAGDIKEEAFGRRNLGTDPGDWGVISKKVLPMTLKLVLVVYAVKAVKSHCGRIKGQIEEEAKQKAMGSDKPATAQGKKNE